jgi:hypothetical protein
MRHHTVAAVAVAVVLAFGAGSALGQESSATIRTYQGVSYKVVDPSLEVFYTIGEPKEKNEESTVQSSISISTSATAATGGEQPAAGEKEEKLMRGHARATSIVVSRQGVETRIAWDQIQDMRLSRKPVTVAGLPPYIPHYRYAASVKLMSGQQVEADYVNFGTTIVRGTAPNGRVDIPWEEVESIIFER